MVIPTDSLHLGLLNKCNQSLKRRLRLKSYPDLTCSLPKPHCSRKSGTEKGRDYEPKRMEPPIQRRAFTAVR